METIFFPFPLGEISKLYILEQNIVKQIIQETCIQTKIPVLSISLVWYGREKHNAFLRLSYKVPVSDTGSCKWVTIISLS